MKKFFFKGIIILAIVALSILNWDLATPDSKSSLLLLMQIEALSDGENPPTVADQIALEGNLSDPKQKSFAQQPVVAFKNAFAVQVNFTDNLGLIVIRIYNVVGGMVFQQSVMTANGLQTAIDITSFSSGNYSITFTNVQNQSLSGGFVI
jgi:hypothetical protein